VENEPGIREQRLRQILRDLERSLSQAIAESPEIGESLRRIHDEGFELQMVFECKSTPEERSADEAIEEPTTTKPPARRSRRAVQPVFRIHGEDLAFLRSIGIDPTRRRGAR
jgi:hypothetical protein